MHVKICRIINRRRSYITTPIQLQRSGATEPYNIITAIVDRYLYKYNAVYCLATDEWEMKPIRRNSMVRARARSTAGNNNKRVFYFIIGRRDLDTPLLHI